MRKAPNVTWRNRLTGMQRLILVSTLLACPAARPGEIHELHLVKQIFDINNDVPDMLYRFEPDFLSIEVGDKVRFLGTVKGHTVHSVRDMRPEGGPKIAIMPRQNPDVIFDVPGIYGIRCRKHARHGMVAGVVVGADLHNLEKARVAASRRLNPFAHSKMNRLLDRAEAEGGR